MPDRVVREAYSQEVSSAGFWPGGGAIDYPAFYAYAYPEPTRFRAAAVRPQAAFYHETLREFLLPYEAVCTSPAPDETLLEFLESTYEAAADVGKWDRATLECAYGRLGEPGVALLRGTFWFFRGAEPLAIRSLDWSEMCQGNSVRRPLALAFVYP